MSLDADTAMRRTRDEFLASMASQLEPQADGSEYMPRGFDYVVPGSEIKVGGEWCRVVAKVTAPKCMFRLSPESDRAAWFWYEVNDGETWLLADPW